MKALVWACEYCRVEESTHLDIIDGKATSLCKICHKEVIGND